MVKMTLGPSVMSHFVGPLGCATLPGYVVRHYSGCFHEGVLGDEISI